MSSITNITATKLSKEEKLRQEMIKFRKEVVKNSQFKEITQLITHSNEYLNNIYSKRAQLEKNEQNISKIKEKIIERVPAPYSYEKLPNAKSTNEAVETYFREAKEKAKNGNMQEIEQKSEAFTRLMLNRALSYPQLYLTVNFDINSSAIPQLPLPILPSYAVTEFPQALPSTSNDDLPPPGYTEFDCSEVTPPAEGSVFYPQF